MIPDQILLRRLGSRKPIPPSVSRRHFDQKSSSLEHWSATLLSGSTAQDKQPSRSPRVAPKHNHPTGSAIPQAWSSETPPEEKWKRRIKKNRPLRSKKTRLALRTLMRSSMRWLKNAWDGAIRCLEDGNERHGLLRSRP
ncbi:hypothetical protein LB504_010003 [Fusarium proliferatum]|nr:hypothetical protein LB504_010003 [Fusarium proliferatum]